MDSLALRDSARPHIGRDREMGELRNGLGEAAAGHGRLFLVAGEPGIGKTRLCDEFASEARAQRAAVFWGRCWESGGAPPFWPWVQIVRAYVDARPADLVAAKLGTGAAELAHMVPNLLGVSSTLPHADVEDESARFRLFDATTTFLKNAAAAQPLVLLIDDIHAADVSSLLLLQYAAREIGDSKLLIVGTFREAELIQRAQAAEIIGELARASARISLRGLNVAEVETFIASVMRSADEHGHLRPSPELVSAVHQASDGNPFFIDAIVRAIQAERPNGCDADFLGRFRIPDQVREAVRRHLRPLSEAGRDVLTTAAVVGREFDRALITSAHGSPALIDDALNEAVAAGLVLERDRLRGRYGFRHALIRETLYDDLKPARRATLHRQVGEVMETLYAADPDPHLPTIAHHFTCAPPGADARKTISYCQRAGERALALLAYEEASAHFARALETLAAAADHDPALECQLLLALGDSYNRSAAISAARRTFLKAAALARKLGTPEQLAMAAVGFVGPYLEEGGVLREPEIGLLQESLTALGDEDSRLRATLLSRLAIELIWADPDRTRALAADAVQIAHRIGDLGALAAALDAQHAGLMGPFDVSKRLELATDLIHVGKLLNKSEITLRGHYWRIIDLLELSDIAQADVEIDAHARKAEDARHPGQRYWAAVMRAMRMLLDARFGEVEQSALQAFSLGQQAHDPNAGSALGVQIFVLRWHQGRLGELENEIRDFVDRYPRLRAWRSALALVYCELGRGREAANELQRLASRDFADLPRDDGWMVALNAAAEVSAYLNDTRCAAILYELLGPFAGRNLVLGDAVACAGSLSHALGLLAATMSQWDAAARHFEDALAMHQKMGAPALVARTEFAYGAMLLRDHRGADAYRARALLTHALDAAGALGMESLAREIPNLLLVAPETDGWMTTLSPATEKVFRREGQFWTVAYDGQVVRVKDSKGLQYLALLLARPGQEIAALDLAQQSGRTAQDADEKLAVDNGGLAALDEQAKREYRERWRELREELSEAEELNDLGRASQLKAELDFLTQQLNAAVDLHGRDRKTGAAAERARLLVTKRIKSALKSLDTLHPPLAHHLRACVKTGYYCAYTPPPGQTVAWQTSD